MRSTTTTQVAEALATFQAADAQTRIQGTFIAGTHNTGDLEPVHWIKTLIGKFTKTIRGADHQCDAPKCCRGYLEL